MAKTGMNGRERLRLPAGKLAATCDPTMFKFQSTEDIPPLERGIIGQERAVRAMEFGLRTKHPGYNIFLTGPAGTGKTIYTQTRVRQVAAGEPTPQDWCYVYNFERPDQPACLCLPAGRGSQFRRDMDELIEDLGSEIHRAFDSAEWERRRGEVVSRFEQTIGQRWRELEEAAQQQGFAIQRTPTGIITIPLDDQGQPITPEEFSQMDEEAREALATRSRELQGPAGETLRQARTLEKEARAALKALEQETGLYAVGHLISQLKEGYSDLPRVCAYLDQVRQDVVEHLDRFRADGEEEAPSLPLLGRPGRDDWAKRYQVNAFVDNARTEGAPVVFENNPTYYNLFGKVEYRGDFGTLVTDFTLVKPGAVHLANGGYLVLQAADLFTNPLSWAALKRTLKTGQARIENLGEQFGIIATAGLKPEPVPTRLKVLIIGNPLIYHLLYMYDDDFRKLFKVRVDFDVEMDRTPEHIQLYASFASGFCRREGLHHPDPGAMARIVEYSSRLAEDQERLSTRFHDITEVIFEASNWAEQEGSPVIQARHVDRAMEERIFRSNRVEEKILELIAEGTLLVDTEGTVPGQVNGLSILDLGDYVFGKPNRITARAHLGEKGVMHIERETEMSGPIHSKGVFILSAYMAGKYAQDMPLALSASLTFEQLYEEVEGDSASSAELCALLSELAGLPVDQGVAVTGSVNQKGEVQPIGGVNEKVEGFYHVCKAKGLTGRQGVIIPAANVRNLMLKEEVRRVVADGRFHVWAVRTVDEGIELLTGVPAGERRADGTYPERSVNDLVERRLRQMAEAMRRFGHDGNEETGEEERKPTPPRKKAPRRPPNRGSGRGRRRPRGKRATPGGSGR